MRKALLFLTTLVTGFLAMWAFSGSASAAPVACAGGSNGWFDTYSPSGQHFVVNCAIDLANGYHMTMDVQDAYGRVATAVIDAWVDTPCNSVNLTNGTSASNPLTAHFKYNGGSYSCKWNGIATGSSWSTALTGAQNTRSWFEMYQNGPTHAGWVDRYARGINNQMGHWTQINMTSCCAGSPYYSMKATMQVKPQYTP